MINPFKSKKGLGRGLSSLIGDSEKIEDKKNISISSLVRNKYQPRKKFDEVSKSSKYSSEHSSPFGRNKFHFLI